MAQKTYMQALNDALREEMERDPNVLIFGEDVGQFGGCFGVKVLSSGRRQERRQQGCVPYVN